MQDFVSGEGKWMSWLVRILAALGIILALVIVIVLVIGNWGTREETTQALSMSVGNRTVMVAGHYKDMRQESIANGIKVVVDGHEVQVTDDQLSVDGKTEVVEPDQDVMIYVGEDGKLQVKTYHESEGAPAGAPQ
jgi:hypothetical protein